MYDNSIRKFVQLTGPPPDIGEAAASQRSTVSGVKKLPLDKWRKVMEINLMGSFHNCMPDWALMLREGGFYPSGGSAVGYGRALILAEIAPDRPTQIFVRGRANGDSRLVCDVHWFSNVEEGSVADSAVVAGLHAEPVCQEHLEAAREEAKNPPKSQSYPIARQKKLRCPTNDWSQND